jgi:hypothetical protein
MVLSIAAGQLKIAELLAAGVAGYGLALVVIRILAHWSWLVYGLAGVDLLIPEDDRYTLHGASNAGFELEPWRILVFLMIVGWVAALMVDPRVRTRKTKFDGPLVLIGIAIVGSEAFNPARVSSLSSFVIKALVIVLCLMIMLYVLASVIRTRETIERLLCVLVCAGSVEGFAATLQRTTRFNIFDHMHRILPMFKFNLGAEASQMLRSGHFRAVASAGHPIELATVMAMLTPIAAYLAIRRGRIWLAALPFLLLGNLSSGSRTGVIGLLVVLVVFLLMRPRETFKCWPALIPILAIMQLLMPGAISGTLSAFFPKGGLIAQQSQTFAAHGAVQDASRLSRLGPQLHGVFAKHNEFFGEGYGTRIVGRTSTNTQTVTGAQQAMAADNAQILDDQWLGNLLDTGLVGVAAWLWLFARVIRRLGARARLERGTAEGWLPVALAGSVACYAIAMYFYDAWGFIQGTIVLILLLGCASALLWLAPVTALTTGGPTLPASDPDGDIQNDDDPHLAPAARARIHHRAVHRSPARVHNGPAHRIRATDHSGQAQPTPQTESAPRVVRLRLRRSTPMTSNSPDTPV